MKFTELGLSENLLKAIKRSGFEEATPIQAETIPLVLKGNDVIGQAQTGTGKTAAFGLPVLQHIDPKENAIQAVIVSPTRELAIQTQEELFRLGKDQRAKVQVVYGGADIRRQINALKRAPQVLVGTPGRLLDHIRRRTVDLKNVKTVILDEADEMLDMGFVEDIESIIRETPAKRQTLLFSATMPPAILKIGEKFMTDPKIVKIKSKELTTDLVDQFYVRARDFEKFDTMTRILDVQAPELTIVFGRTKRRVDELSKGLEARGYNAKGIHGDLSQQRRMSILKQFKAGKLDILVATDVAARGLDISGVTHVYNYDIPQDPESYVHRIGRTGRAGHHGVSVTFVTPNEMDYLRVIEKLTKKRMEPLKPPTEREAFIGQISSAVDNIEELIKKTDTSMFEKQAEKLMNEYEAVDLVAALLNEMTKDAANEVPVKITPERPLPRRKSKHFNRGGGHYNKKSYSHKDSNSSHKGKKDKNRDKFNRRQKSKRKYTIRSKKD
ncbi:DEAD/DEAH box helicase [Liquorilactobacillus uvarum]|uniref:DEAD-box ATP-dependent RNA helicase CshA n=1 Tax=Liquorilactobacillus uvarum DSM 19971 TaxID=1423812 RepID=A0A0R1Q5Z6_9LACO|nr:DEAD/DEAH box helicase [Liquorilactobacillus uvarum]KRL37738.1 ATP-dependent RNA helicase [Liquorilactobacillus uvarum DSM 19971]